MISWTSKSTSDPIDLNASYLQKIELRLKRKPIGFDNSYASTAKLLHIVFDEFVCNGIMLVACCWASYTT